MDCVNIKCYSNYEQWAGQLMGEWNCFNLDQIHGFLDTLSNFNYQKSAKFIWTIFNGGVKGPSGEIMTGGNPPWGSVSRSIIDAVSQYNLTWQPDSPDNDGPGDGEGLFGYTDVDGNPLPGDTQLGGGDSEGGEGEDGEPNSDGDPDGDTDIPPLPEFDKN